MPEPRTPFEAKRARPLLGTLVDIRLRCAGADQAREAMAAAFAEVAEIHDLMSFHRADSDVDRLNQARPGDWIEVDARTAEVLACAASLRALSAGAFDVGVADALVAGGLLPRSAGEAGIAARLAPTASRRLARVRRGDRRIDLGGIAKGFAVDAAVAVLQRHGVESALVNAGGDLRCFGPVPRDIQGRDPVDPGRIAWSLTLADAALASSATRALFGAASPPASALIDPASGKPLHDGGGASVVAPCCLLADALTKVVLVTGDPGHAALAAHGARTVWHRPGAAA